MLTTTITMLAEALGHCDELHSFMPSVPTTRGLSKFYSYLDALAIGPQLALVLLIKRMLWNPLADECLRKVVQRQHAGLISLRSRFESAPSNVAADQAICKRSLERECCGRRGVPPHGCCIRAAHDCRRGLCQLARLLVSYSACSSSASCSPSVPRLIGASRSMIFRC
jgi:hypothetical protein